LWTSADCSNRLRCLPLHGRHVIACQSCPNYRKQRNCANRHSHLLETGKGARYGSETHHLRSVIFATLVIAPTQPPKWDFGLGEITECIGTVIAYFQRFFFAALCRLGIPRIGLHENRGDDSNAFIHVVVVKSCVAISGQIQPLPNVRRTIYSEPGKRPPAQSILHRR
jgi:hypothetical protein